MPDFVAGTKALFLQFYLGIANKDSYQGMPSGMTQKFRKMMRLQALYSPRRNGNRYLFFSSAICPA
jgi:hypothetical protein